MVEKNIKNKTEMLLTGQKYYINIYSQTEATT